ncbi:(2Fe-2S)-binding protein [Longispora sp. NPDC051575]|uniref:(2Fe-2S)-binding protein n=1 Tax=Longispora sp. NPDC051575 TaxID=3154943 RepID=UPI00342A900B
MTAVPREELFDVLAAIAVVPRYTLRTGPDGPGWSTVRQLCAADATTDRLIDTVARRFAIGTPRVAGSFTIFGYASRLLGPVVAALATRGVLLDVRPDRVRWRYEPTDGFQFLLTEPAGSRPLDDRDVGRWWADLIDGHLGPVVDAVRARAPGAAGMLWGNVAASVAGALDTVARTGPTPVVDCGPLLDHGPLAGAGTFTAHRGRSFYVRRSCCLHYQIPAGGKCGDCALLRPAELRVRWDAALEA